MRVTEELISDAPDYRLREKCGKRAPEICTRIPWPARAVDADGCVVNNDCTMAHKLSDKKLAVLGTGKLGGILLRAYLKQGLFAAKHVTATVKHAEKAAALGKELGVALTTENRKAVRGADIVLLGVKPQALAAALTEIAPERRHTP